MVHFAGDLLAAGFAGADSVPACLVDPAAVSNRGNRSGGSPRFVEGHIVSAWTDFARTATGIIAERKRISGRLMDPAEILSLFCGACRTSGARGFISDFSRASRPGLTYAAPPALEEIPVFSIRVSFVRPRLKSSHPETEHFRVFQADLLQVLPEARARASLASP